MEAGEFATIQELAEAVGLAERHVTRQLRLPPVLSSRPKPVSMRRTITDFGLPLS